MSGQAILSLAPEGDLGEAPRAKRPPRLRRALQRLLAEDIERVRVETPIGSPPPSQGIFAIPENDFFHQSYSYSDLNSTAHDIRLIHVFKDEHCDLIQCEFLPQSSLREASRSYHTVSYCAGDPLKAKTILLQGIKFNVFANLSHALDQTLAVWKARDLGGECILWVDQICINQQSDAERSHQVGFMRDIYTNSRGTFISLSTADSDETGPNGMNWLKELHEAHQSYRWGPHKYLFFLLGDFRSPRHITQYVLRENLSNTAFMEGWASFYDLVHSPWWRRAWIHQEFICSPGAIFMYHDSTISSSRTSFLLLLCQALQDLPISDYLYHLTTTRRENTRVTKGDEDRLIDVCKRNTHALDSLKAIELLLNSKKTWRGDEDLKKVLAGSRHCRSSDPRDRIFAFLGLAHPGFDVETDYGKSNTLNAVIIQTAKKVLEFERDLEMLAFAVRATKTRPGVLPSWVPDWSSTEILEDGHFAQLSGQEKQFQQDAVCSLVIQTSTSNNNAVLRVRGLQIDTLERHLQVWTNAFYYAAFVTARGHTVRCRSLAQEEDELWILMGSKWPFILRPCGGRYMVVSEAENIDLSARPAEKIHFDEFLCRMRSGLERLRIIYLC